MEKFFNNYLDGKTYSLANFLEICESGKLEESMNKITEESNKKVMYIYVPKVGFRLLDVFRCFKTIEAYDNEKTTFMCHRGYDMYNKSYAKESKTAIINLIGIDEVNPMFEHDYKTLEDKFKFVFIS